MAAIPPGQRIYAVGDIHGRLDLLHALAETIEADNHACAPARSTVILLGDLIDRGPQSASVVDYVLAWQEQREVRILSGNHEEMFLASFDSAAVLTHFMRYGGRETLLSYGIDADAPEIAGFADLKAMMEQHVPLRHRTFMAGFEDMIEIGDYLFVHAGIAPGVALKKQRTQDLRWIREPFLSHEGAHSHVVVHGHTITRQVVERRNRIGIDTGAVRHGRLSALVLEGTERRYIQAEDSEGQIATFRHDTAPQGAA